MDKDPFTYAMTTYAWVIVLSSWGGVAGYIRKLRKCNARFSFGEIIGDVCISAFVGIITFYMCEASGFSQIVTAAFVGVSGHMGSRSIFILENAVSKFISKRFGPGDE